MSLGERIADAIPDSVFEFVHEHPRVLTLVTGALVICTMALSMSAVELDVRANDFRKARLADAQIAVSEALGG